MEIHVHIYKSVLIFSSLGNFDTTCGITIKNSKSVIASILCTLPACCGVLTHPFTHIIMAYSKQHSMFTDNQPSSLISYIYFLTVTTSIVFFPGICTMFIYIYTYIDTFKLNRSHCDGTFRFEPMSSRFFLKTHFQLESITFFTLHNYQLRRFQTTVMTLPFGTKLGCN